ncbi:MAG TPA: hypothetical protein VGO96_01100, partial [Pyrinomonadaceae bacterium]|nr:hypothetical protein [Pyrinomonadaceae bacterium]
MHARKFAVLLMSALLILGCSVVVLSQGTSEGTPAQRIEIMRSRLDSMRRSLNNALASMNAKDS